MAIRLEDLWSPEKVAEELEKVGETQANLNGMMTLFGKSPELFYNLACVSVPITSPHWMMRCAAFAYRFQRLPFKYTGEISGDENGGRVRWRDEQGDMEFEGVSVNEVRAFMDELNGVSVVDPNADPDWKRGKAHATETSPAEVYFRIFAGNEEMVT